MPDYTMKVTLPVRVPHDVLVEHVSYCLGELLRETPDYHNVPPLDVKFVREES